MKGMKANKESGCATIALHVNGRCERKRAQMCLREWQHTSKK